MMRRARLAATMMLLSFLTALPCAHGETAPAAGGGEKGMKAEEKGPGRDVPRPEVREAPAPGEDEGRAGPVITYTPPRRGAPRGRVGGGSRGIGDDVYTLFVLAPDHVGLTVEEQPLLYWYLSRESSYPVELTVIEEDAVAPLVETRLPPPVGAGIHALNLEDHRLSLEPEVRYLWFVSIVADPERRSRDVLAGGAVERVTLPRGEREKYLALGPGERAIRYAAAGYWYDAVRSVMEMTETGRGGEAGREMRQALLRQVDLELPGD